jgi:diaminopimelate decarboxylase
MDINELVARFGSPLYGYDLAVVARRADELSRALPNGARLFYSLKANPLPDLVGTLVGCGCGAEVSSTGELRAAMEAGCPVPKILYTGPGKGRDELGLALSAGVTQFSAESWTDLERLGAVASTQHAEIRCLLRINPSVPGIARLSMTGIASQFGFEEVELLADRTRLARSGWARMIHGIHIYFGTQVETTEALAANTRAAIRTAEMLSERLDLPVEAVDVGGGFPWPFAREGRPDLGGLKQALEVASSERQRTATAQLWFESGRYLSASSGTLYATVLDVKSSKEGRKFVVLDTGIHQLGGMSGLGRLPRPVMLLDTTDGPIDPGSPETEVVDLVGPLCSPLDCLARDLRVPRLKPGDLVRIPNVGAYGLTASLNNFTSRVPPIEVTYRDGNVVGVYRLAGGHSRVDGKEQGSPP